MRIFVVITDMRVFSATLFYMSYIHMNCQFLRPSIPGQPMGLRQYRPTMVGGMPGVMTSMSGSMTSNSMPGAMPSMPGAMTTMPGQMNSMPGQMTSMPPGQVGPNGGLQSAQLGMPGQVGGMPGQMGMMRPRMPNQAWRHPQEVTLQQRNPAQIGGSPDNPGRKDF